MQCQTRGMPNSIAQVTQMISGKSIQEDHKETTATPPDSIKQPLTPPPSDQELPAVVQTILHEIKDRESGRTRCESPWQRYSVDACSYEQLDAQIEAGGFVNQKLRFDYFPSADLLVLRMPSGIHETLLSSILGDITIQLRGPASSWGSSTEFVQDITNTGSETLTFADAEYGRHEPDASFRHCKAQYPGVVIEVSYSQKRKDLPRLADDYILGSDGNIRLVVGIDIEYKGKCATMSTWRPKLQDNHTGEKVLMSEQTISNQEFRDARGDPAGNEQTGLRIRLEDFAPDSLVPEQKSSNRDLFISSARLCEYLYKAELLSSTRKLNTGVCQPLQSGVRKRRRSSIPPEELITDDELQFKNDEHRAAERAQFSGSS